MPHTPPPPPAALIHNLNTHTPRPPHQAPMQPVHAIELYPMPQARVEGGGDGQAPASDYGDDDAADGGGGQRELRLSPGKGLAGGMGGMGVGMGDDGGTEVSVEEAAALGSNVFALLTVGWNGSGWGRLAMHVCTHRLRSAMMSDLHDFSGIAGGRFRAAGGEGMRVEDWHGYIMVCIPLYHTRMLLLSSCCRTR